MILLKREEKDPDKSQGSNALRQLHAPVHKLAVTLLVLGDALRLRIKGHRAYIME